MKTRNRKPWLTLWLGCIGIGLAGIWYIAPAPTWPRETAAIAQLTHTYGTGGCPTSTGWFLFRWGDAGFAWGIS